MGDEDVSSGGLKLRCSFDLLQGNNRWRISPLSTVTFKCLVHIYFGPEHVLTATCHSGGNSSQFFVATAHIKSIINNFIDVCTFIVEPHVLAHRLSMIFRAIKYFISL